MKTTTTCRPRLRAVLAAALLPLPLAAQGSPGQATEELRLVAQIRVRSSGDASVGRLLELVPDALECATADPATRAALSRVLEQLDGRLLPATLRAYLPSGSTSGSAPPDLVCTLTTRGPLPRAAAEVDAAGEPAPGPGGAAVRRWTLRELEHRDEGVHRYVFGFGSGSQVSAFDPRRLPRLSRTHSRFAARLRRYSAYAFVDLGALLPPRLVRELKALGGPGAVLVGAGLARSRSGWTLDLHSGTELGVGLLGQFLTPNAGLSDFCGRVPWTPGLALQADLGGIFVDRLRRSGLEGALGESTPAAIAETLLAGWTGEIGFFQPPPERDATPGPAAPFHERINRRWIVVVRVDGGRGDELLGALGEALGDRARHHVATGSVRVDDETGALHIGHHEGIVALCRAPDPETAAHDLDHVLYIAERPAAERVHWRIPRALDAPIQLWLDRATRARISELVSALDPAPRLAPLLVRGLDAAPRWSGGSGLSVSWYGAGLRVRYHVHGFGAR